MTASSKIIDDGNRHFFSRVRKCLKCDDKFVSVDGRFICRDCDRENADVSAREANPSRSCSDAPN